MTDFYRRLFSHDFMPSGRRSFRKPEIARLPFFGVFFPREAAKGA